LLEGEMPKTHSKRGGSLAAPAPPTLLIMRAACALSGGLTGLANYLGARVTSVARWLEGKEKPPSAAFIACVDIVLLHERHLLRDEER
jgi:DNA-binding transcriptional regulator YiaG